MFLIEKINYKNIEELKSKSIKKHCFPREKSIRNQEAQELKSFFLSQKEAVAIKLCYKAGNKQPFSQGSITLFSRVTCFIALAKTRPCDLQMQQKPVLQIDFGTKL